MPHMRNITVQFAVPEDDPSYRLTNLRDDIQETLYDNLGMSGSFSIESLATYTDPTGNRSANFFEEKTREEVKTISALEIIEIEAEENILRDRNDLIVLEEWAKIIASQAYEIEVNSLEYEARQTFDRLLQKGFVLNLNGCTRLSEEGFKAIGWGV